MNEYSSESESEESASETESEESDEGIDHHNLLTYEQTGVLVEEINACLFELLTGVKN